MNDRISICEVLVKRNEIDPFLKRMMTGDEKWVTYDNIVRKRSWSKRGETAQTVVKPGLTTKKVLLCIRWHWKGIIYYELLPYGQT
ncbi:mariner transposase [Trichonephila clavipes]|nr:mariner transposase [Trichonephila clavipes]